MQHIRFTRGQQTLREHILKPFWSKVFLCAIAIFLFVYTVEIRSYISINKTFRSHIHATCHLCNLCRMTLKEILEVAFGSHLRTVLVVYILKGSITSVKYTDPFTITTCRNIRPCFRIKQFAPIVFSVCTFLLGKHFVKSVSKILKVFVVLALTIASDKCLCRRISLKVLLGLGLRHLIAIGISSTPVKYSITHICFRNGIPILAFFLVPVSRNIVYRITCQRVHNSPRLARLFQVRPIQLFLHSLSNRLIASGLLCIGRSLFVSLCVKLLLHLVIGKYPARVHLSPIVRDFRSTILNGLLGNLALHFGIHLIAQSFGEMLKRTYLGALLSQIIPYSTAIIVAVHPIAKLLLTLCSRCSVCLIGVVYLRYLVCHIILPNYYGYFPFFLHSDGLQTFSILA